MKKINTLILIFSLVIPGGCFNYDSELNIPCRGNNCITFDITTSTGLNSEDLIKNAQVEIGWQSIGGIFLSVTDRLATGKTDENGNFHFSVSSDSSRLKIWELLC